MQRLTSRRHLRLPWRFRHAQKFKAFVGLSFCYYTRTCAALRPRTIWSYASSPHPSAILNVFGLIMIQTTSRDCFNHAQNNHVPTMIRATHSLSDVNTFHNETCFTRDQNNQVLASCERSLLLNFLCPNLFRLESWGAFVSIGYTKSESGKKVL